jgi:hypothetical protein
MNNIKRVCFLITVVLLGTGFPSEAQLMRAPTGGEIPQQSVYLELGGNGLLYSLNYDVLFDSGWGFRLGGNYYPHDFKDNSLRSASDDSYAFLGVVMGIRTFGQTAHKLELGGGLLFGTIYDPDRWDFIEPPGATFSLGYRYYPEEPSRFSFKAAFTPVITRTGLHPRIGISFGITLTPEGDADF